MAAVVLAGRRAALTIAWAPRRRARQPVEIPAVARMPATVAGMPVDTKKRASVAGKASRAALTPEQREESARAAARAAHSVTSYAKRLAARWTDATDDERREARRVLREAGVIR